VLLSRSRVEEGVDHLAGEAVFLVLVHLDDSAPVFSDLGEVERLGEIDQVEDVLLEARTTETLRRSDPHHKLLARMQRTTEALRNLGPTRESLPTA
jgi:hypothetical protein